MSLLADAPPGTASPRVLHEPARTSTEGDDAAWLASSYGLVPDPWQTDVLRGWLGVRDGRWASARCGAACPRQNGKNGVVEVRELYGMVALGERILHTAHEVKTARKAFARLLEFFDNPRVYPELHGMVREIRRTNGQEAIVLENGGSVEFIARSRGSGRGFSVDVLVADEAQELSEDAYAALRPTISASANPQVILLGTPPPPGATGEVFERFRSAAIKAEDDRLHWAEWSCLDDLEHVDLDSIDEWRARNPALGIRLQLDTVSDERAEFDPETFARERLGWWKPRETRDAALDLERWASLADPNAKRGTSPTFGVATAPDRSWSAVAVAWTRDDGLTQVMLVDYKPGAAWVSDRVSKLRHDWDGAVAVDVASRSLVADADKPSQQEQAQAHNALGDAVEGRTLRHGNEPALNTSVRAARWKPVGDSRVLDRKAAADISPLAAAALAYYAHISADVGPSDFFMV